MQRERKKSVRFLEFRLTEYAITMNESAEEFRQWEITRWIGDEEMVMGVADSRKAAEELARQIRQNPSA